MCDRNNARSHPNLPQIGQQSFDSSPSAGRRRGPMIRQNTALGLTTPSGDTDKSLVPGGIRIECAVCFESFGDSGSRVPRSLSCGHSFCTRCLKELAKSSQLACPKCYQPTSLLSTGISGLSVNYGILEILYSKFEHDDIEDEEIDGGGDPGVRPPSIPFCSDHGDRLSSYCEDDNALVCSSCLMYGSHKGHKGKLVVDAAREMRDTLMQLAPDVRDTITKAERSIAEIDTAIMSIEGSSRRISDEIDEHFDELMKVLESRKKQLKFDVLFRSQNRVEVLMEQKESLSLRILTAQRGHDICSQLTSCDNSYDVIKGYPEAKESINNIFIKMPSFEPVARDDLTFNVPENTIIELDNQFVNYGNIRSAVSVVKGIQCESHRDGVRLSWEPHNYTDNIAITYAVQVAREESDQCSEFVNIYRGGNTKVTWSANDSKYDKEVYRFRIRVQTNEGVGNWSEIIHCTRADPDWTWDSKRRSIKIDLDENNLKAYSHHSSGKDWVSVAGNKLLMNGQHYMELEIVELAKHNIRSWYHTKIAIGVVQCTEETVKSIPWHSCKEPVGKLPGCKSWAFHVSSGMKVYNYPSLIDEDYGKISSIEVGDKIGMLIDFVSGQGACISFFCNGQDLGVAFTRIHGNPLLPVVSICDKFQVRLKFPPPPYDKRNPRLVHL